MIAKLMITGERRSGTTRLANILNAQTGITIYRDFLQIERIKSRLNIKTLNENLLPATKRRLVRSFEFDDNADLGISMDISADDFSTLLEFYTFVLEKIASPTDILVGHKTTMALGITPELLTRVPELRSIFVIRDPRDMVASALKLGWSNAFELAEAWQNATEAAQSIQKDERFCNRFMIIRFEDLVGCPDIVLEQLASFLGIDNLRAPETMTDYSGEWRNNSSFGDLTGNIDSAPVGRWSRSNPEAGHAVELVLGPKLYKIGYARSSGFSFPLFLRLWSRWTLYRVLRRVGFRVTQFETKLLAPMRKRVSSFPQRE